MYGTQAAKLHGRTLKQFENDVKMYGTQADEKTAKQVLGLRMM